MKCHPNVKWFKSAAVQRTKEQDSQGQQEVGGQRAAQGSAWGSCGNQLCKPHEF